VRKTARISGLPRTCCCASATHKSGDIWFAAGISFSIPSLDVLGALGALLPTIPLGHSRCHAECRRHGHHPDDEKPGSHITAERLPVQRRMLCCSASKGPKTLLSSRCRYALSVPSGVGTVPLRFQRQNWTDAALASGSISCLGSLVKTVTTNSKKTPKMRIQCLHCRGSGKK
jgi:hypothetical protein